ncbi:hypothetical protein [Nocardioides sp.]|uniref:hypothetical protein n=1 Tax=Nocardioides sp. TaxID=35761 RepID=UPI0027268533|nr:hypothetical protein [Nocardioides sp.]MDO9455234.1 hypothetical protein [Nocardioides sp.]
MNVSTISKLRFDVMASYARSPLMRSMGFEVEWFQVETTPVIASLIYDTDGLYSASVLAPDLVDRYRGVRHTDFHTTPQDAVTDLLRVFAEVVPQLEAERVQGDEPRRPVDFFTPVRPSDRLNHGFLQLTQNYGWTAAHEVIKHMMRWYEDVDGNFVEQFQTTGFDARIWELYLFATLNEADYSLDRSFPMPDFVVDGPQGTFALEATTVNPRVVDGKAEPDAPFDTPEEKFRYVRDYMPIRYAGPLTAKLNKKYWEREHVDGLPLVLAIQDFHEPRSMSWTGSSLSIYLYGLMHETVRGDDGIEKVEARKVETHQWGTKTIPSNFFALPGAEHISAVVRNSSGTLSKFNRMGVSAGFGSPKVHLIHSGWVTNHDPNATLPNQFSHAVEEGYDESWIAGMDVFHNPRALKPLDFDALPGAANHVLLPDGTIESHTPEWHPLSSTNAIVVGT